MDLKHLRTFVTVAEARTESKASQVLHISQSALSRQVSNLEQEFGLKLFERIGRRLILTPVGEQLIDDCRQLLGQAGALGERVGLMRRGDAGVLKVAAPPQTIESVLSTFLVRYAKRFPNVSVQLFEALGREQTPMLERGEVHIGIRHDQGDLRFESFMLPPDEVLAACNPANELGKAGMIDIGHLAAHPLLLPQSGYSIRRLFDAACRVAEVTPKVVLESRSLQTLLALAEDGHGVAIIPSMLKTKRYELRIVRVAHRRKPVQQQYTIQWDRRRPIPPYANHFCAALADYMREAMPITRPVEARAARRGRPKGAVGRKRRTE
jgi:LysR family transcriptional regulator, nitrogen assimilation regulatory protein